ncbi:restriction endonuclease subunit S [uncultured Mitsuokella sp.]|uniref:restriction endonuclease subunit S n=2 Tax=uncultured Mitsuokella sp. TaxID=453120 RepID=UPI0025999A15|nr:restriction endonuclease subunit S [uncultured Mitsuokella sp.]
MNAQDLKNSILQRAIEGKLVPQRKEEGTAKELLAEIRAEKARLIKEKKIKKSKPLPEITDDEKPFDIPESWEWVRFEDIFEIARGGSPRPIKQFLTESDDGINWIKIGDTDIGGKYILCTKEKIIPEGLSKTKLVEPGDLLLTNSMSYGRPYILKTRGAIHDGWLVLSPYLKQTDKEFFYYVISSTYVHNEFARTVSGAVVKNLNKDKVKKIIVPLPPLAEQHRIVAKIEELHPDIDAYDKVQTKLQAIEQRFPDDMKKSLLQYAIEGKLVPQRKEEGTAKDLLAKIRAEKARLVKEKKIKKSKPLPAITDDEKPFDIPDSWEWVRLGEIIRISSGDGLSSRNMVKGDIPVFGGNGITGYHNKANVYKETIVIGRVGYYCGSVHVTPSQAWITDNAFITQYTEKYIDRDYLVLMLRFMNLGRSNNATAQPVVSGKKIYPRLFPLPPLAEQRRIVAKLEELLPLCQQLASHP